MKSIKKLFSGAMLAAGFLAAMSFSANAVIITQDILDSTGFVIGDIQVELEDSALNTGLNDSFFDGTISLLRLDFTGLFGQPGLIVDIVDFEAAIDTDFVEDGIEFFAIDASLAVPNDNFTFQLIFDAFSPDFNFIDVFDTNGTILFFDTFTLGEADLEFTEVSAPAMGGVLVLAMAALYSRRKHLS